MKNAVPAYSWYLEIKDALFAPQPPSPYRDKVGRKKWLDSLIGTGIGRNALEQVLSFIAILIFWELFVRSGLVMKVFFPTVSSILKEAVALIFSSEDRFFWHLGGTLQRVGVGFSVGGVLGLLAGTVTGAYDHPNNTVSLGVDLQYSVPKIIYLPLFLGLFGIGEEMRFIYISFSSFFPVFYWTRAAVREFDLPLVECAKDLGATVPQILLYVVLPMRACMILEGLRMTLFTAWAATFIAETKVTQRGLGFLNTQAENLWDINRNFAMVFIVACLVMVSLKIPEQLSRLAAERWPNSV